MEKKKKPLGLHNERFVLELQTVRDVQGLNSVTPSQVKAREKFGVRGRCFDLHNQTSKLAPNKCYLKEKMEFEQRTSELSLMDVEFSILVSFLCFWTS